MKAFFALWLTVFVLVVASLARVFLVLFRGRDPIGATPRQAK
jgi:hypothetical protein